MRAHRLIGLVLCAALTGLAAIACGGSSPAASPSPSATQLSTFSTHDWHFSLSYPTQWVKTVPAADSSGSGGLQFRVVFADPEGTIVDGAALDTLEVSVYKMGAVAKPGDLRRHERDFAAIADQLRGTPPNFRRLQPYSITELGGQPALTGQHAFRVKGKEVAAVTYLVPRGDLVYWISAQASRDTWESTGRAMSAALATLKFD